MTSATLMANMPAAESAVEIANRLDSLGIGVHLNLTDGKPLSGHPGLAILVDSQGRFKRSVAGIAVLSLTLPYVRSAIRTELAAQIQWLLDRGITPTHLDSHRHFHTIPHIFSIVCQLAHRFGIRRIRYAAEPAEASKVPWPIPTEGGRPRAALVRVMARLNRLANPDFFAADALLGVSHVGKVDINFFKAVTLYNTAPVAEVMTHPGHPEGLEETRSHLVAQRKIELDALCSQRTRRHLTDAGIRLVNYSQI
jgi:predicted glycoside hydrolase/deacetylase ChbG (UPF0249 family)